VAGRARSADRLPEFERLRDLGKDIKNHVLANLDLYLEAFEAKVQERGGEVHWARDAAEARAIVLDICKAAGAKTATKSKSMITEEIGLNAYLETHGVTPVETDLGEYILQISGQRPSHLVGPVVHLTQPEIADIFERQHGGPRLEEASDMVAEARRILRERYFAADVGITGANFLIAETGSAITGDQRGQRRAHARPAQDPHRRHQHREGGPHRRRRLHLPAAARPLGHGPGVLGLHHRDDRPEAPGRPRRS
jgi:L-lactate dehydrogenase complex protein LldF